MPGPVSDSYDPEFGTGNNAHDVREAVRVIRAAITKELGEDLVNIVELAQCDHNGYEQLTFRNRELRIIRFCLDRAMESI